MTRADEGEGREPGHDDLAARFAIEERTALVGDLSDLQACLSVDGRAHSSEIIARAVIALTSAEAEVARLTAALAEAERERDEAKAMLLSIAAAVEPPLEDGIWSGTVLEAVEASEASASALRERVATLEAALQPFAEYAADMPGADFGEGEIGEYYHDGFRRSICTQDLRAARTALEAPHADE